MRMSPASRSGSKSAIVLSTTAAGTISHTARGFSSFFTRSGSEAAPTAFSWTNSLTVFGDLSNTTQSCPFLISRRAILAPILPSPIIPSCISAPPLKIIAESFGSLRYLGVTTGPHTCRLNCKPPLLIHAARVFAGILKNIHKFQVTSGNLRDSCIARDLLRPQANERPPETSPAHCKADETRHGGGRSQPLAHLLVVFSPAQDDATDFVASTPTRSRNHLLAVLPAVESLDLPDVRLNLRILKLLDGLGHQPGANL